MQSLIRGSSVLIEFDKQKWSLFNAKGDLLQIQQVERMQDYNLFLLFVFVFTRQQTTKSIEGIVTRL